MFDAEKFRAGFMRSVKAMKIVVDDVVFEEAAVDGQPAALVTVAKGSKNVQRIFTEADANSPKIGEQIRHLCAQVES